MLSYIYWDPSPYVFSFVLPIIGRPIVWYGVLFALGFFLGYYLYRYLLMTHLCVHPQYDAIEVLDQNEVANKIQDITSKKEWHSTKKHAECSLTGLCDRLNSSLFLSKKHKITTKKKYSLFFPFLSCKEKQNLEQRLDLDSYLKGSVAPLSFKAQVVAEKLTFTIACAAIIGARIAEILFYQDIHLILSDPFMVFRVWEGGLASHGGVLAALITFVIQGRRLSKIYSALSTLKLLDIAIIPSCLLAALIRFGNFINQEILGHTTSVPWAVLFGHPADGTRPVPRHPVQLYEMGAYFFLFVFFVLSWCRDFRLQKPGKLFTSALLSIFTIRFFLEFFKQEQSVYLGAGHLFTMGQYLSLPVILLSSFGLYRCRR